MGGAYAAGVRTGVWRRWHADGQLALEGTFAVGVGQGPSRS